MLCHVVLWCGMSKDYVIQIQTSYGLDTPEFGSVYILKSSRSLQIASLLGSLQASRRGRILSFLDHYSLSFWGSSQVCLAF